MDTQDAGVVERVLGGDRDAFGVLVERYSRMVFSTAYRIVNSEPDADEVVQETFLKAYKNLKKFESRSSFATWLFRIASNCALDSLRRTKRMPQVQMGADTAGEEELPELELPSEQPGPERMLFSSEMGSNIEAAMQSLTAMERTAFALRHFEGCSVQEISAALGVRGGAAKEAVCRAVSKLRKTLTPMVKSKQ